MRLIDDPSARSLGSTFGRTQVPLTQRAGRAQAYVLGAGSCPVNGS